MALIARVDCICALIRAMVCQHRNAQVLHASCIGSSIDVVWDAATSQMQLLLQI